MSEIITVGLDLAKNVFQLHGVDASGRAVLRNKLRRDQVLAFFGQLPPCLVAMEACGGAHFWGREIGKLGHAIRLIPPAYVKPFVKRQKMGWLPPSPDGIAMCQGRGVQHHEKERTANEGYNDRNLQVQRRRTLRLPQGNPHRDRQRSSAALPGRRAALELRAVKMNDRCSVANVCGRPRGCKWNLWARLGM